MTAMASTGAGSARNRSVTRMSAASGQPPATPATVPMSPPMSTPLAMTASADNHEARTP
jgi:hypothetical protein